MEILCLKWGNKYHAGYVNRLFDMVNKNFNKPFNFTCITDDPTNIDPKINIELLPLEYDLKEWWWKLSLFEIPANRPTMFIDLDVVIQNNITEWEDLIVTNKLCTIKAYWKDYLKISNPHNDHDLNSSVMLWQGDLSAIWEDFVDNKDYYIKTYRGIDSVLYNHHIDKINWIPEGHIYSRLYGIDKNRFWNKQKHDGSARKVWDNLFFDENYKMCIFNGFKRIRLNSERHKIAKYFNEDSFIGFERYWNS